MNVIDRNELVEEILDAWRDAVGNDLLAYRGHVYRVLNFSRAFADDPAVVDSIAVASAFHDLGIWSDRTVDYLEPSARRAREYLERIGRVAWSRDVEQMVVLHHKLTAAPELLAEAFRKADLVDVSLGIVRFGLPRDFVRDVQRVFPAAGFHGKVVRLVGGWMVRHPLNPLPMFRW